MEIKKDIRNDLMQRRQVQVILESEKNPTYADCAKMLADNFKGSEDAVMVEQIKGTFGKNTFIITASIYDSKELKEEAFKRLTKTKKVKGTA